MIYKVSALLLALLICASNIGAWNGMGHMTVAYIAFQKLDPAVKPKVHALLKKNPDYTVWVQGIPVSNQEERLLTAFLRASRWPDDIKSKAGYSTDGTSNGNIPPNTPAAKQNKGYVDKFRHKYWHFHDTPFSSDGTPTKPPPSVSALTQIPILANGLKNSPTATIRSYDLVWLIHLVGDVHQPLHDTARFTVTQPNGDDGGNGVKLSSRPGAAATSSLHTFWDGLLGESEQEQAIALGDALNDEIGTPAGAGISDVATWIDESFHLAQTTAYAPPIRSDGQVSQTNSVYRKNAKDTAEKQVVLAGHRLANLINDALKP